MAYIHSQCQLFTMDQGNRSMPFLTLVRLRAPETFQRFEHHRAHFHRDSRFLGIFQRSAEQYDVLILSMSCLHSPIRAVASSETCTCQAEAHVDHLQVAG